MRCKKHTLDISGGDGVCASCLREHLSVLMDAETESRQRSAVASVLNGEDYSKPLSDQRFYCTPQLGSVLESGIEARSCKTKSSKFAILSRFFWPKSKKSESNVDSTKSRFTRVDRNPSRIGCRQMLPETTFDGEEDLSEKMRRTPVTASGTMVRRSTTSHGRNILGLTFCLSPLVRASPNRKWNKTGLLPDSRFADEIRVSANPPLLTAASFCANRSRKLADFGRFSNNR